MAADRARGVYLRRRPELGVLHRVLVDHLEDFLADVRDGGSGDGRGLPRFVEHELRDFISCGSLARGFARFRCDGCGHEVLVAFSCKGRAVCSSCCGRRMATLAAHLTDHVLGGLPVRQWVLTLPHRLRYAMAWDHRLCLRVLAVHARAVLGFERRRARRRGGAGLLGQGGGVTAIQRFGSAANLNVHFHTVMVQGVFVDEPDGTVRFVPSPAPSDLDVARLLAGIRRRVIRLVERHGIDLEQPTNEIHPVDGMEEESPVLAGIAGASVVGRIATGPRAGRKVLRLGRDPDAPWVTSGGERHAHLLGFDLHANVSVPAGDAARLEHLLRYILRPPIAQDALEFAADGQVLLKLRRPWHDGTRAMVFSPAELIEKVAALIPRPRLNLLIYHGIFGPRAKRRRQAVAWAREQAWHAGPGDGGSGVPPARPLAEGLGEIGAPAPDAIGTGSSPTGSPGSPAELLEAAGPTGADGGCHREPEPGPQRSSSPEPSRDRVGAGRLPASSYVSWARLLERIFEIDVLACPGCGGRLRLLATIENRAVIKRILDHLGVPSNVPQPRPAQRRSRGEPDLLE